MTNLEQTTMYDVAAKLWLMFSEDRSVSSDSPEHWTNLSPQDRDFWFQRAVMIIDTAEPVWRRRALGIDPEGYRWAVVAPNGQVFDQRSEADARSLAYATGMRVVREHRDGGGYKEMS